MRRRLTGCMVAVALLLASGALASPAWACKGQLDRAYCQGHGDQTGPAVPGVDVSGGSGGVTPLPPHTYWVPTLRALPEPGCWTVDVMFFPELGAPEVGSIHQSYETAAAWIRENWSEFPPCPDEQAPTPEETAAYIWQEEAVLAKPRPRVEPGNRAITGLPVFLEIDGDLAWSYSGRNVELRATPTFEIDWGDHSPRLRTSSRGGPYPDGDLTHVYRDAGAPTVTVTATWSAQWRLAGSGAAWEPVPGILETSGSADLLVGQVQAVRRR